LSVDYLAIPMPEVGASEAKTHLSQLLDRVERGETITTTRHGRPVARLIPIAGSSQDERRRAIAELKELRAGQTLDGLSVRELIDQGRR
jgi:prevent-host-death family protein